MKRFSRELLAAVEPVLDAARAALRDLDPDDVPASLRRVAAHSGVRLPPPLAAKLVAAIDELEWLRDDAAQKLGDDAAPAARAMLARDDGWWAVVAEAVGEVQAGVSERRARELDGRLGKERDAVAALKAKLKQQRLDANAQLTELRSEVKSLRKDIASSARVDANEVAALERRRDELERLLDEARADRVASDAALDEMRTRLRMHRRELADARRALDAGGSASVPRDPILLARELDLMAASVPRRPATDEPTVVAPGRTVDALVLPAGVRPDRAEAVEWLVDQPGLTVVVDGYNVLFSLEPGEFTTGKARRRLGDLMGRFARRAKDARVRIVFDSTLPGSRDTRWAGPGVTAVFADADHLADEEVVATAAATDGPVVVVSSDREVRENAAAVGALVLWSEAFVEWIED